MRPPKSPATSDGGIVVAWTSDSNTVLQKLDVNGKAQWGKGVVLSEAASDYSLADLHAAEKRVCHCFRGCATRVLEAIVSFARTRSQLRESFCGEPST